MKDQDDVQAMIPEPTEVEITKNQTTLLEITNSDFYDNLMDIQNPLWHRDWQGSGNFHFEKTWDAIDHYSNITK